MRTGFARGSSRPTAFEFPTISTMGTTSCSTRMQHACLYISDPFRAIIARPLRHTARTAAQPYIAGTIHIHVCKAGKGVGERDEGGVDSPAERGRPSRRAHTPFRPPCEFVHRILLKSSLPIAPPSTLTMHTHHALVRHAYSYTAFC